MARVVAVKLPDDIYAELERKARRRGYTLVSDYLRDLILRDLGYKEEGVAGLPPEEVRQLIREELAKMIESGKLQVEPLDTESLAKKLGARLERKLQDMINPWTAKIDSLSTRLAELQEKLEALEEKVSSLEQKRKETAPAPRYAGFQPHERFQREHRGQRRRSAIERLREQGVVFEHEVQWLRDRDAFFEKLRREGALVMVIDDERVALDPGFWEAFKEKLATIKTPNEEEVKNLLRDQEYELFRRLRRAGMIYFDHSKSAWVFTEEPEQA